MKTIFTVDGENRSVFYDLETGKPEHFKRGPRVARFEEVPAETSELKYRYRVLDDDYITYFWGRCNNDSSFAPVDELGEAYGAIHIEYKNENGEYEEL